jgi:hypothetical protein
MEKKFKVKLPRKKKKDFIWTYGRQRYLEIQTYLQSECNALKSRYDLKQMSNFFKV